MSEQENIEAHWEEELIGRAETAERERDAAHALAATLAAALETQLNAYRGLAFLSEFQAGNDFTEAEFEARTVVRQTRAALAAMGKAVDRER